MPRISGCDFAVSVAELSPMSEMVVLGHVLEDPRHHKMEVERHAMACFGQFCAGLLFLNATETFTPGSIDQQMSELAMMDGAAFLLRLLCLRDDQASLLSNRRPQGWAEITASEWETLIGSPERVKDELLEALAYCASVHRRLARPEGVNRVMGCFDLGSTLAKTGLLDGLFPPRLRVGVSQYLFPHVAMVHTRDDLVIVVGAERLARGDLTAVAVHELAHLALEHILIPAKVVDAIERDCQKAKQRYGGLYSTYDFAEELLVDVLCRFYADRLGFSAEGINDLALSWQREILQRLPVQESRIDTLIAMMLDITAEITIAE
jgi:hypothetical protein